MPLFFPPYFVILDLISCLLDGTLFFFCGNTKKWNLSEKIWTKKPHLITRSSYKFLFQSAIICDLCKNYHNFLFPKNDDKNDRGKKKRRKERYLLLLFLLTHLHVVEYKFLIKRKFLIAQTIIIENFSYITRFA